jgi:hypothetical protein
MGPGISILNGGSPVDTFHELLAGLLPNGHSWILRVISRISATEDPTYKGKGSVLYDSRILGFQGGNEDLPHVAWTTFKKGLLYLTNGTDKGKKVSSPLPSILQLTMLPPLPHYHPISYS